jgi:phospholipid transport system substrate-binding protein
MPSARRSRRCALRGAFVFALIAIASGALSSPHAAVPDPLITVRGTIGRALAIIHDSTLAVPERRRQVAEQQLDLARMAQGSLGGHWSELSGDQRIRFVPLFAAFIEDAYLDKIQDYAKLRIDVSSESFADPTHARVNAQVFSPADDPIPITFMLEARGDEWTVYDVAVEDVSMVENYRAQFDRVIRRKGIPQLLSQLEAKQAQLAALLGGH